ncbi:Uncharacterised protein [Arachnia propionica]|nr:Uncharacterised protein [Arachnia propionica]
MLRSSCYNINCISVPIHSSCDLSNGLVFHEHLIAVREHEQLRRVQHIHIEPTFETYRVHTITSIDSGEALDD